ncbi:MAG: Mut7-C RNAse domain-containing protein [Candidatus Limnocylindrales bacterium]
MRVGVPGGSGPPDPPIWIELRAYGPLNDFLPAPLRGQTLRRHLHGTPAVKDTIEAAGIPHPEVELVLVNGEPVTFARRLAPGDRVAVYPPFRAVDLESVPRAGPLPLPPGEATFVLDGHLGRLAAYLRLAGFDTLYRRDAEDDDLARLAADGRVLLTRDIGLLRRSMVLRGAFVRSQWPACQLVEMFERFDLAGAMHPFSRCLACNGRLEPIERDRVGPLVPPRVYREQTEFRRCPRCGRIFWRGSHVARMARLLERTVAAALAPGPSGCAGP